MKLVALIPILSPLPLPVKKWGGQQGFEDDKLADYFNNLEARPQIRCIIFGAKMPDSDRSKIMEAVREDQQIVFKRAFLVEGKFDGLAINRLSVNMSE